MATPGQQRLVALVAATWVLIAGCDAGTGSSGAPAASSPSATDAPARGAPAASAASTEPEREVVAETLAYAEVDDQLVHGHFAFPADMVDPLPGIIVIHERWGLDDGTRALAERLAGQGYVVLAVDLFGGKTSRDLSEVRPYMVQVVENPDLAEQNIRQAYDFLVSSAGAPRIGALGWSFGGNWALNTAMMYPDDLAAAVIYYGQVTDNAERLSPVNTPILGIFGENDRGVTVDAVRGFESVLEELGKNYRIEVYSGVGHAFADQSGGNYNPEVAGRAWAEVVSFLEEHLAAE
jgi:carboxymethylenebutenolidase